MFVVENRLLSCYLKTSAITASYIATQTEASIGHIERPQMVAVLKVSSLKH